MHHPYPETLPVECVTEIIGIVRSGEVREKVDHLANCAWTIAGYGLRVSLGEPQHEETFGSAGDVDQLEECKAALESACSEQESFGAAADAEAIDPATLAIILQLAIKVITALINRRKNK